MFERIDWTRAGHVLFVTVIVGYSAWYAFDAIDTVENVESAMAVVVCAALVVVLGGLILAREGLRSLGTAAAAAKRSREAGAAPLASSALLSAATILYVVLIGVIGLEISTFVYLACVAWLLGVRSILVNLFYSAVTAALLIWMVYAFATPPDPLIRLFGADA